ncbi:MAG: PRD domain-containing protein, partial [Clostridiaceae bacterium]
LLFENKIDVTTDEEHIVVKDICQSQLQEFLTYLNPSKVISLLVKFTENIETQLKTSFTNPKKIQIIVHAACALERMLINDSLIYRENKDAISREVYDAVNSSSEMFSTSLKITLSEDEKYYICESIIL